MPLPLSLWRQKELMLLHVYMLSYTHTHIPVYFYLAFFFSFSRIFIFQPLMNRRISFLSLAHLPVLLHLSFCLHHRHVSALFLTSLVISSLVWSRGKEVILVGGDRKKEKIGRENQNPWTTSQFLPFVPEVFVNLGLPWNFGVRGSFRTIRCWKISFTVSRTPRLQHWILL